MHDGCFVFFFLCNEWMNVPRNSKMSKIKTYLKSVFSSVLSSFSLLNALFSPFLFSMSVFLMICPPFLFISLVYVIIVIILLLFFKMKVVQRSYPSLTPFSCYLYIYIFNNSY